MKSLYVMGAAGSGKTAASVGIALKAREEGLRVSYLKPVGGAPGPAGRMDEDAVLMRHLLGVPAAVEEMVPYSGGPHYLSRYEPGEDHLGRVRKAFERVGHGADAVIVGGAPFPEAMGTLGLDAVSVASALGSSLLLLSRVESDRSVDSAVAYWRWARSAGVDVVGVILNNVPRPLLDKADGVYRPYLEAAGCPVVGIIPRRAEIAAPTVREFHEVLGGEVLAGEEGMDLLVEEVLVGAMTTETALHYFRRALNKAVITGGDRTEIALAALETSTSVLILTGGLYPSVNVVARAAEKGVPVLLVHHDTYTAIEMLHGVSRRLKPEDAAGIALARENVERYCEWKAIRRALA